MGTSLERSSAFSKCLAARAEGYAMEWDVVSGESLYEIRAKTQVAIERAHETCRPTLLEIDTYRYYGHSVADANAKKYRAPEEVERYRTLHDPLRLWKARLIEENLIDEATAEQIDHEAREEAESAARFADESPFPSEREIFTDIYWEVDNNTENGRRGRHFFND
jgi:pyruvate dehydrogenase E1 component alpha subunit